MEHNPLPGLSTGTHVGSIRRLLGGTVSKRRVSVDDVENSLSKLMLLLKSCSVDSHVIGQLLKQVTTVTWKCCIVTLQCIYFAVFFQIILVLCY